MDEVGSDGLLRHDISIHPVLRFVLMGVGLFVVGISVWELHRGLWPLNFLSPFLLFILLGAFSVGVPAFLAGVSGDAVGWTVGRGKIEIVRRNPFRTVRSVFAPADVQGFEVTERVSSESDNTWMVTMTTSGGERFATRDFGSEQTARLFGERIETLFRG